MCARARNGPREAPHGVRVLTEQLANCRAVTSRDKHPSACPNGACKAHVPTVPTLSQNGS
eukprot:1493786-Amphidinium_carterae.1